MRYGPLSSLRISNFRALKDFSVPHLGRVNLIVGKNNAGKSSLLEAIRLYAERGAPQVIAEILEARDEVTGEQLPRGNEFEQAYPAYWNLFHGRRKNADEVYPIEIGPLAAEDQTLRIALQWYVERPDEQGVWVRVPIQRGAYGEEAEPRLGLSVEFGGKPIYLFPLSREIRDWKRLYRVEPFLPTSFVPANGLEPDQVGQWWDKVALTQLEHDVVGALKIVVPETDRLTMVLNPVRTRSKDRMVMVKLRNSDLPVPLRSMGDGMNRIFGLVLALANAKGGLMLVDEVENGIHYSIQKDVWKLVFSMASKLNAQVFATTHSWDCVRGFQEAAQEATEEEGVLLRLEHRRDNVRAVLYTERDLLIATRDEIEVR